MRKGSFRRYCKSVYKGIIKYTKNYIREIIEEINVKSFKKYKYNFLCEFIGSFVFVFFISIYMLQSNSNEEYIITHSKQINPYDNNEIFQNIEPNFINETNEFIMNNTDNYDRKFLMQHAMFENTIINTLKSKNDIDNEVIIENMERLHNNISNSNIINNDLIKEDFEQTLEEIDQVKHEIKNVKKENKPQEIIYTIENDNIDLEPIIKDVKKITFKDDINEYSKIKISDIDHIDLENIDKYEKLSNTKNIINSHHSIYTILGCLIYVIFVILGAHINPAYTYALWFLEPKKYGFLLSTLYVCFQYLGGILASILIAYMYGSIFIYSLLPKKKVIKIFVCETLCTFILTMILINLYFYKKRFMKESKEEDSIDINFKQIRNMASSSSIYDNLGSYENMYNSSKKRRMLKLYIENRYVKYIINHIFYLIFIFSTLLFFIFVTSTTLNPMFMTSTIHTYLYFKLFRTSGFTNLYTMIKSFFSIQRILQMIVMYIYSLPFWIGPYVGSAVASIFILLLNEKQYEKEKEKEKDINVIDTKVYQINNKEKLPLLNTLNFKHNAYLVEYNNNIHQNIKNTFMTPAVY